MNTNTLAYAYNTGGLNNQKLALLGLFLEAARRRVPVGLPKLYNLDHTGQASEPVPFDSIYQIQPVMAFARRCDIEIRSSAESDDVGGWEFFSIGSRHIAIEIAEGRMTPDNIACDFFRSLIPITRKRPDVAALRQTIVDRMPLAVQLRIEKDWQIYSAITLKPTVGDGEDYLPSFSDIMAKVANTFKDRYPTVYVVCDELTLPSPIQEIRETCRRVFGLDLIWKSDLLGEENVRSMSVLERSVIDFDAASLASTFVGLSRSSFSNLVTFERYSATGRNVTGHYLYNVPGPYLVERHDNGGYAFAKAATAA